MCLDSGSPSPILLASINLSSALWLTYPEDNSFKQKYFIFPSSLCSTTFTNNACSGSQAGHPLMQEGISSTHIYKNIKYFFSLPCFCLQLTNIFSCSLFLLNLLLALQGNGWKTLHCFIYQWPLLISQFRENLYKLHLLSPTTVIGLRESVHLQVMWLTIFKIASCGFICAQWSNISWLPIT